VAGERQASASPVPRGSDLAAREQLIEQYMSLVRSLARRYSYRGEQLDDLVQIGSIGLIKAIDRFDLTRGVELTTYATPNIIGEIKAPLPRSRLGGPCPARLQSERAAFEACRGAHRAVTAARRRSRACEGRGRRRGRRARGARVGARLFLAFTFRRAAAPRTARISTRWESAR